MADTLTRNKAMLEHLQKTVDQLSNIIDSDIRIMNNNIMQLEPMITNIKQELKEDIMSIKTGFILIFSEDREKTIQTLGFYDTRKKAYEAMKAEFRDNEKNSANIHESGLSEESGYIIYNNDRTIRWKIIDIMNPI